MDEEMIEEMKRRGEILEPDFTTNEDQEDRARWAQFYAAIMIGQARPAFDASYADDALREYRKRFPRTVK